MGESLKFGLEEQDRIVREVVPEIDSMPQIILYRMALSAVGNDTRLFRDVLANVEILYGGSERSVERVVIDGRPEFDASSDYMSETISKGSYAVLLAMMCENDIDKARRLNYLATENLGPAFPLHELARIATGYIVQREAEKQLISDFK